MSFDLCQIRQAKKPYYIESISTNIYSIEELCFYLYENVYLIDQTIVNEALCDWIRDELGLKKLYRQLYEQLEKQQSIAYFIVPIFREVGYLSVKKLRELQEKLGKLEVQPEDSRQKLKGDYLVKSGTAWKQARTKELLRKYVSALPLYLPEEEYKKKLRELGADPGLISKIQEYNSKILQEPSSSMKKTYTEDKDAGELIENLKEEYRRSSKC